MGSFVKDPKAIRKFQERPKTFYAAEVLTVYWETRREIVERILPAPLKAAQQPLVHAFVAHYPRTSFSLPYREAALFVLADYRGELGTYCLSMLVDDDMAMGLGREICGFPKKIASMELSKNGNLVEGTVRRHGIDIFRVQVNLDGKMNAADGQRMIEDYYGQDLPVFNIKYTQAIDGSGFDLKPTLVKQHTALDVRTRRTGAAEVSMADSPHDPWAELEVFNLLGGVYTVSDTVLLKGTMLEQLKPEEFLPYSYLRWDWWEPAPGEGGPGTL
ncbi:acetoacetate decarboxylase family protein [Paenibacillus sp. alder61]|uniref:acetoacetate decarboxylase family protein n=1 Tax=Paenibacillus sp. alder61 TaxID=2862948 RepID=UPI001CD328D1|nr:acetoacetate decarboxylase family protein [Paenibacillus sp. alder61]MCA1292193.1 acetoacetate decarboxylase family protein [Paenibacillus sp. alder61]